MAVIAKCILSSEYYTSCGISKHVFEINFQENNSVFVIL